MDAEGRPAKRPRALGRLPRTRPLPSSIERRGHDVALAFRRGVFHHSPLLFRESDLVAHSGRSVLFLCLRKITTSGIHQLFSLRDRCVQVVQLTCNALDAISRRRVVVRHLVLVRHQRSRRPACFVSEGSFQRSRHDKAGVAGCYGSSRNWSRGGSMRAGLVKSALCVLAIRKGSPCATVRASS
jgi:hypothetical protein